MRETTEVESHQGPMVQNFNCLSDWCLLAPLTQQPKQGDLIMPEGASPAGDLSQLLVIKVGPGALLNDGVNLDKMPVKPGDLVWRVSRAQQVMAVRLDGKQYAVIQARDFIAYQPVGEDPDLAAYLRRSQETLGKTVPKDVVKDY